MIPWFVRHLPGPRWLRVTQFLVVCVAFVIYMFGWGFAAASPHLPGFDADLNQLHPDTVSTSQTPLETPAPTATP